MMMNAVNGCKQPTKIFWGLGMLNFPNANSNVIIYNFVKTARIACYAKNPIEFPRF